MAWHQDVLIRKEKLDYRAERHGGGRNGSSWVEGQVGALSTWSPQGGEWDYLSARL